MKLTPKEQKLVALLGFLLILGLVFRFILPEPGGMSKTSTADSADGPGNVSFQKSQLAGGGRQNESADAENAEDVENKMIIVHVVGEVVNPGIYSLKEGSRVYEALEKAGGCLEGAALERINLAQPLFDGQQVPVPSVHEPDPGPGGSGESPDGLAANPGSRVNINTANSSQLETLPGIGKVKAGSIISYREQNGPFKSVEELTNVNGIGEKTMEMLRDLITIY